MKIILIFFLFIFGTISFGQKFSNELNSLKEFQDFSSLPLSAKYGNVSSLKVVYDNDTKKLYFLNSRFYKYHYEFCQQVLLDEFTLFDFNESNYSSDSNKRYLLANINYYASQAKFALEFAPSDNSTVQQIEKLLKLIENHSFIKDQLNLLLSNKKLEDLKESFAKDISIILPSDIYKNLNYQAVSCYKTTGTLRFITNIQQLDSSDFSNDILVIDEIPNFLPLARGIIVTNFQTPLSHVSLLGQNRKIPICACKNIFSSQELKKYANKIVQFNVSIDTFSFQLIDHLQPINQKKPIVLKSDLLQKQLIDVEQLNKNYSIIVGNKAANFGVLNKISKTAKFKVPEAAFAIPFYYYNQHITASNLNEKINNLLSDTTILKSPELLKKALKVIQDSIIRFPVNQDLVKLIKNKLNDHPNYTLFRFRSSTNAEDANGFSGAGLYDSKTVDLNSKEKTIENALQKVWASLWSYEAFMERAYFGINQKEVYMGVLVHRAFPNEAVNGVAITKNIYRDNYIGFVINAQKGDESVVDPQPGIICDQFVCFPDSDSDFYTHSIDIITYSNLNNGELVMTPEEIRNLANQLEIIKRNFSFSLKMYNNYSKFGLDIEFKLDEVTRQLYIKQVRVYNN